MQGICLWQSKILRALEKTPGRAEKPAGRFDFGEGFIRNRAAKDADALGEFMCELPREGR